LRWKTDFEFALGLLRETGVLLVHGSGFDPTYGAGHVRAVILPPIETLGQALDEVERFMSVEKRN
jgi:aspartate/methionine/tyrosine aminotransferase